jgi:aminoglycoside phosphotransferase (APT) family kinase protein
VEAGAVRHDVAALPVVTITGRAASHEEDRPPFERTRYRPMTMTDGPNAERPQTSTRDYEELRAQLEQWLGERVPGSTVSALIVPESNGMSSETVLFDLAVPGESSPRELVARIAPDPAADPVFMVYDMKRQFETMQMVAEHTKVPVPKVLWLEEGTDAIGVPFFVMERVNGIVPPDVLPYTFGDNWFFESDLGDQQRLERKAIEVIAALHELSADGPAAFLAGPDNGESPLRQHVNEQRAYYDWVAADGVRSPLIERGFEWLEEHWPSNADDAVFSWGDARVGNMMFEDFTPVAVLDWEMAAIGPREIDLGWIIYIHRFFQDLVEDLGMPGMPHFMRRETVSTIYEEASGYKPKDLDFYTAYAALRHGIVMFRITRRSIRFGEAVMPEDPDHAILHHAHLRSMIDNDYWGKVKPASV